MKLDERVRRRLAALIEKGEAVRATSRPPPEGFLLFPDSVARPRYAEWRTQALLCFSQTFGTDHTYTKSFQSGVEQQPHTSFVDTGLGILRAALEDVEQGYLDTLQQMAAAEVFSDFLDQAEHLLEHGYVAPAASLAGAVLENGLRSLAERHDVPVKPRDNLPALNSKLANKEVYNRLRQKQVSVWTEVRDNADHGHFDKLTETDVLELFRGVRKFLAEEV